MSAMKYHQCRVFSNIHLDQIEPELEEIHSLGIKSVILFGIPATKDECGTGAFHDHGIIQVGTRFIKERYPEMIVIADTCLCEYTSHGHCGVVSGEKILNDESLDLLVKTAVSQAQAGADIIAPSNMMDGFVAAIRAGLDEAGFHDDTDYVLCRKICICLLRAVP